MMKYDFLKAFIGRGLTWTGRKFCKREICWIKYYEILYPDSVKVSCSHSESNIQEDIGL